MDRTIARWSQLGPATIHGNVMHFTISRREEGISDSDYDELIRVLHREFAAEETGKLLGPYSCHTYLEVEGIRLGVIEDWPGWLDLFARDKSDEPAMEPFIVKLLDALNCRDNGTASQ